jgi:hypothetical protein
MGHDELARGCFRVEDVALCDGSGVAAVRCALRCHERMFL